MNRTYYKDLEASFAKNRSERGRIDRAVRKVLRAGKIENEGAALACVYAALKAGERGNLAEPAANALSALLPQDGEKVVTKLCRRFDKGELEASILWNLGIAAPKRLQPFPNLAEFSSLAADILKPQKGDHILNTGGGGEFMEAVFVAQPDLIYSEWEDSRQNFEMEVLRASLLDFREAKFPIVLPSSEYSKAFVFPPHNAWFAACIDDTPDSLFGGTDVSDASRGWNQIAEVFRALRPDGLMAAIIPAGALISQREEAARRFFTDRELLKMVVVLPHSPLSSTPYSCILVLGHNESGPVRFVDAQTLERTAKNRWSSEEWIRAVLQAVHVAGNHSTDTYAAMIRKEGYDWFPVRYMLAQHDGEIVPLRDMAESVLRGSQLKRDLLEEYVSEQTTSVRCITQRELGNGIIQSEDVTNICLSRLPDNLTAHTVPNHAIVLSKLSPASSAVIEKEEGATLVALDNLYVIELDQAQLDPYYLQAYLASDTGRAALRSVSSGSRIPNLSQANLLKLPVPMLPMEQQREIGARYRKTARKRLELRKQAELQEADLKDVWKIEKRLEDTCDETDQGET